MAEQRRRSGLAASVTVLLALLVAACDSVEERVADHYDSGMELLAEDNPVKAALEFRNALSLEGDHAPSRFEIAKLYEADNELPAALSNYRLTVELAPDNIEARRRLGRLLLLGGDVEGAAPHIEAVAEALPQEAETLALLATLRLRTGDIAEAVRNADAALAIEPDNTMAVTVKMAAAAEAGDLEGAIALGDTALARTPDDATVNLLKLTLLERLGDEARLLAHLRVLRERFPEELQFSRLLAQRLLATGETEEAETVLRSLAASRPDQPEFALDVVRLVGARDGAAAARAELETLLAGDLTDALRHTYSRALVELDFGEGDVAAAEARLVSLIDGEEDAERRNDARVRLAAIQLSNGDRAAAAALVEEVLAEDARNAAALAMRGALAIDGLDLDRAIADLRVAIDEAPDNARYSLLLADAYRLNSELDLAQERFAAATRLSDYDPGVVARYARFLVTREQMNAAEAVLTDGVARNPQSQALLVALAQLRIRQSDWIGVEDAVVRLEVLEGGARAAQRLRAASLERQGRSDDAISILEGALVDANDAGSVAALALARARAGEIDVASTMIDEALAERAGDTLLTLIKAEIAIQGGDIAGAEDVLRDAIAINPTSGRLYVAQARLALATGDFDAALDAVRAGSERAESSRADALLMLAQLLEREDDWEGAIATYATLYEIAPNADIVANNYAAMLAEHRAGDAESLALAERIARRLRSSTVPEFKDTYGWLQYLQGRYPEATRFLEEAAADRPNNAWVRFHAGMAMARVGQPGRARGHLEAALTLDADFPKADEARATLLTLELAAEGGQ